MSEDYSREIPEELMPTQDEVRYDLNAALAAVVSLRVQVPDAAFTASVLGTERAGHGVLIESPGLILTIGYLITEAEQVWVLDDKGGVVTGDVVAYDYETGFGLVQALGKMSARPLELGSIKQLSVGQSVVVAGHGGASQALTAAVIAKQEFAGYWEYVLDEALFTAPPHPNWGGAAVLGPDGKVCAIGSLFMDQVAHGEPAIAGNMSVPVDLLHPILPELLTYGRTLKPARPWLGMFVSHMQGQLLVVGLYQSGPAAKTIKPGDVVLAVAGQPVRELAACFRAIWSYGHAGTEIPLTVQRDGRVLELNIASVDRRDFWYKPRLH